MSKRYSAERAISDGAMRDSDYSPIELIERVRIELYEELIAMAGRSLKVHYNFSVRCVGSHLNKCLILTASGVVYE